MQHKMKLIEWAWLAVLSCFWASSFFFIKLGLIDLSPLDLSFLRISFAAILLLIIFIFSGEKIPNSISVWRDFFIMGIFNNIIPFSLVALAQVQITSGLAAILNATTPVFTVLLAHFLIKGENLTIWRSLGILFGLLGIGILVGIDIVKGLSIQNIGQIAVLGAAFSYACAGVYGRRLREYSPITAATGMLLSATLIMLPYALFSLFSDRSGQLFPSPKVAFVVAGLAISTAITFILYFKLLAIVGSSNLMLVTFIVPISALALGTIFLEEQLSWNEFGGMTLIFAGLIAIDGRLFRSSSKN